MQSIGMNLIKCAVIACPFHQIQTILINYCIMKFNIPSRYQINRTSQILLD